MASQPYPMSTDQISDNSLLRKILFALQNNGAAGYALEAPTNILLRQILYAIQNQTGGGSSNGKFDSSGNPRIYDATDNGYWTLTAPGGILTLTNFSTNP